MSECVCIRDCFLNHEGRHQLYNKGMVMDFNTCPDHFMVVTQAEIDLDTATEEFLFVSDVSVEEIRTHAKREFKYAMPANIKRDTAIRKFVSIRDRYQTPPKIYKE